MNDNTTLREVKQNLRHNRKVLNDILEAGLGIGLEELIRKGVLNAESKPHEGTKASGRGAETIQRVEHDAG